MGQLSPPALFLIGAPVDLTEDQLGEYIKRKLGQPFYQKLEIDKDSITDAITDARICYSRWKPLRVIRAYLGFEGILKIDPDAPDPLKIPAGVNGVLDINWTTNLSAGNPNIESQMLSGTYAFYGVRSPLYDIRFLEYQKEWVRFAGKELSSYPEWCFRLNEETNKPALWLYSPGYATNWDVTYSARHKTLKTIPDYDEPFMRGLALAKAKQTLGEIRSKYDKVLVANTSMQLNGPALITEGTNEWNAIEDQLRTSVVDQAPIWV